MLLHLYDSNVGNFQFTYTYNNIQLIGIDGISIWLILLVNKIIPIVILNSWKKQGAKKFII